MLAGPGRLNPAAHRPTLSLALSCLEYGHLTPILTALLLSCETWMLVSRRRSSGSSNFTSQQIGSADSWPSQTSSATSRGCWGQAFPSAVTPQGLSWHRCVDFLSLLPMPSIAGTLTFSVVTSSREKMSFSSHPRN